MATEVERDLARYFEWVEGQSGSCLHRDPSHCTVAASTTLDRTRDDVAPFEWPMLEPHLDPPRDRRAILAAVAAIAVLCLAGGVLIGLLVRPTSPTTDEPVGPPATSPIDTSPPAPTAPASTTPGSTTPVTGPADTATAVAPVTPTVPAPVVTSAPIAIDSEAFSVPIQGPSAPTAGDHAVYSSDGSAILAVASGMLTRIDVATASAGPPQMVGPGMSSAAVRVSSDGTRAYGFGSVVDTATGATLANLPDTRSDTRADFSPDGTRIVVPTTAQRGEGRATVFDSTSGEVLLELTTDDVAITWAIYSPDGSRIMTQGEVGVTRVWDATTGEQLSELTDSDSGSTFSPDGTSVLSIGPSGRVRVRDAVTGEQLGFDHQLDTANGAVARFSPDGSTIVIAEPDPADNDAATVTFWSSDDGALIGTLPAVAAGNTFGTSAFAGGRVVTSGTDGSVDVWSLVDAARVATITPAGTELVSVAFSPDGTRIVGLGTDKAVHVWEIP